jgi:phosphate transport system substrate-binding protein
MKALLTFGPTFAPVGARKIQAVLWSFAHRAGICCLVLGIVAFGGAAEAMGAELIIKGGGSTFAYPIYSQWFAEFRKSHPDVQFQYEPIGSGAGIVNVTGGVLDFGASDAPMTDKQLAEYKAKHGWDILHFPTVLGAVVPIYNLPSVAIEIKFTPEILAGIYSGKIARWNDPALAKVNPEISFPDQPILVAYRSDGSGTTYIWTDYLTKVSAEFASNIGRGTSVPWPTGVGGQGNAGLAQIVKETPYSIGYTELSYAEKNKLPYGPVQNQAGKFVKGSLDSVNAAAKGVGDTMPADFRISITNPPGEDAYPISGFTYLLVPRTSKDKDKTAMLKQFLQWSITDGQKEAENLHYGPLPQDVVTKEQAAFSLLQ